MCTVLLPPGGYPIAVNKYIRSYQPTRIWSVLSRYGGGGKLPGNEPSPIGVTTANGRRDTVAREIEVNSTARRMKCEC
jgi:hypothetical protein